MNAVPEFTTTTEAAAQAKSFFNKSLAITVAKWTVGIGVVAGLGFLVWKMTSTDAVAEVIETVTETVEAAEAA